MPRIFAGHFLSGTVDFAANISGRTITVDVAGDTLRESGGLPESFPSRLSNPSGGATIGTAMALGRIQNDDASLDAATIFKAEGGGVEEAGRSG